MDVIAGILIGIAIGIYLNRRLGHLRHPEGGDMAMPEDGEGTAQAASQVLYQLAAGLEDFYEKSAYPADLLAIDEFQQGVQLLSADHFSVDDLLTYYSGSNAIISGMALEALSSRSDEQPLCEPLLANINSPAYWPRFFALRTLEKRCEPPFIATLLSRIDASWSEPVPLRILKEFLVRREKAGEAVELGALVETLDEDHLNALAYVVKALDAPLREKLSAELESWKSRRIDLDFLASIGNIRKDEQERDALSCRVEHPALLDKVLELESAFNESPPRSVVIIGEAGVGKTVAAQLLSRRLMRNGWTIFEASAGDLLAGQMYIGQLEERVRQVVNNIGGKRKVLWIIPNIHEALYAGTHKYSQTGLMDMIMPFIEKGEITVLGETRPIAYERMLQQHPRMRTGLKVSRMMPLSDEATLAVAGEWAARVGDGSTPVVSDETLEEAMQLTRQYIGSKAAPGNLLQFLEVTLRRLTTDGAASQICLNRYDLLVTLSQLTGLPRSILDDREGLDLSALQQFFTRRVMGQPEVVDCLVERVAMIKAGLTDPGRPQGVFLFAGPTGTGKTEIAKTLAEFLFGSAERMIRLDMSEFQTPATIDRILGESEDARKDQALVNLIRKQPFSVVLLDEFEKSDPNVWDLFLQVFDDGRLTDRRGNTADFRHAVIIMTSNLGGVIPRGAGIGFTGEQGGFAAGTVSRAIESTFRREFINRIDRMVVFHPLSRSVMRKILRKELAEVLQRRGLRNRTWAVEWDDSAIELLLDRGFTEDLGARPLKRAIERYVLSPLAMTIVNHQFPEGDQFLYVRSGGKAIEVEFIDPDAPDGAVAIAADPESTPAKDGLHLPALVLDAHGSSEEVAFLKTAYETLSAEIEGSAWQEKKSAALAQTGESQFWESAERWSILGMVEYMDRIEAGYGTAGRLAERLARSRSEAGQHYSIKLLQKFAHQLYLLRAACDSLANGTHYDAFLRIEAGRDSGIEDALNDEFARRLGRMYLQWVERRRMRMNILRSGGGEGEAPYELLMAISGYAAYAILMPESGLHVLEIPDGGKSAFKRCKVHVRVVAQPEMPAGNGEGALLQQALATLRPLADGDRLTIVRRYREAPSPLVRDSVRNWRTGRLDRVLDGDFDLIAPG